MAITAYPHILQFFFGLSLNFYLTRNVMNEFRIKPSLMVLKRCNLLYLPLSHYQVELVSRRPTLVTSFSECSKPSRNNKTSRYLLLYFWVLHFSQDVSAVSLCPFQMLRPRKVSPVKFLNLTKINQSCRTAYQSY